MTIVDKVKLFRSGNLLPEKMVCPEEMTVVDVRGPLKCFNSLLFEKGVANSSLVLSSDAGVFMGAHSYMNEGGYLREGVFIGRYCSIGRRVSIGAGMHSVTGLSTHPLLSRGRGVNYNAEQIVALGIKPRRDMRHTVIGNDVWIGDGVVIVSGVNIGTGAVIGANAVVTGDVPPYAVFGGVPARQIRLRHPDFVVEELLNSSWWEFSVDRLRNMSTNNVFEFIDEVRALSEVDFDGYVTFQVSR